jgi:signal transduction histidine kinase
MRDVIADEYAVEARYQNQLVFQLNTHLVQSSNALREQIYIDLPDVSLLLNITPTISASEKIRSALPEIGLLAGIIFSGLLGYTIHLYQHAGLRRRRQVAAQHELNVALELLQNANKAKSNFLARMSHELRTPLNAIIGFSQIIKDQRFGDVANERYLEYSTYIFDSGNHLLNLIGDVLDLSKIEAGELEIHPGLPPLNADRRAVKQMLSNLVSNAIKFTPQGGTVAVYASTTYESVRIDVTDTGIGMTKQETQIALAPFQQVANPFTSDDLGTGLGLPIVKSLIELHNGRLSIISNPRSGTRVTLTFPH